jgi:D-alanine-D-alanine ligase
VPVDVIFPVLHGENGEDGSVQGLFQLSGIPFVGCGICASAVSMDKSVTKLIAATTGVRQANWLTLRRADFKAETQELRGEKWWKNYRVMAGGLLVLSAILLFIFR